MRNILFIIFALLSFFSEGQQIITTDANDGWLGNGNSWGNNSTYLGTNDNRSFRARTNNVERFVIDTSTVANAKLNTNFFIDQTAGVNALNPIKFSFQPWAGATSYGALFLSQHTPSVTNFFAIGDTNLTVINAPLDLYLRTGNREFMAAQSTYTSAGTIITFDAITNTISVANAQLKHIQVAGSVTTWTPGTTPTNVDVLISAHTHSALTTATITNDYGLEVDAPTAGTGMTQTNVWAIYAKGNLTASGTFSPGGGIIGTKTNDNATALNVGEYASILVALGSAVSFTTATAMNISTLSLTAGDWDVEANINVNETTATVSDRVGGITSTSATIPVDGSEVYCGVQSVVVTEKNSLSIPRKRFSLSSTTTIYLVGKCTFSAGTATGYGSMTARRIR